MSRVPLNYVWRNLATRRMTTALTAGGMALVVFVFTSVLMLEAGLRATMIATGRPDNVLAIRAGSETEIQSTIDNEQLGVLEAMPELALDAQGSPLAARECVVLYSLVKRSTGVPTNVTIRGTSARTVLALRPQARIVAGRMFRPGSSEIVVGQSLANRFDGVAIGQTLAFARRDWLVVGILDAGRTAFSSELWGDADQLRQAFRRNLNSALVFRLANERDFPALRERIKADRRLNVEVKPETQFYADQSKMLAGFIRILGITLSLIFSVGAVIGAMITMYAAVANRTAEIGTLRAIGFSRRNILTAFLAESLLLSTLGGLVGLAAASLMQSVSVSTMNWQTFSELAFAFRLTPGIAMAALTFALAMGLAGGVLPAWRAARLNIVSALRSA